MELAEAKNHPEVKKIFDEHHWQVCLRVDHVFFYVILVEWLAAVIIGIGVTPMTWVGTQQTPLETGLIGLIFGGIFAIPPLIFTRRTPGEPVTRYMVAFSQVCFNILLIYLTGGRIETHFHIFVFLAVLAVYRDWRVLWLSAILVILDHFVRGYYVPMTIYGSVDGVQWRWLEHAGWVLVACFFLTLGIFHNRSQDMMVSENKYELVRAREEAIRASSMKSSYLSNMSHEIRTPLNSILGFSDILKETRLDSDQSEYVKTISRCSDSLMQLINGILDMSKIENGLMEIDRHPFDVIALHEDIQQMFSVECAEKGLEFVLHLDSSLPQKVIGDSHRIRQILMNLTSNAVKFTEVGTIRLEVLFESGTHSIQWKVSDTGKGIKEENLKNLFSSFYQEDAAISRNYGGSGLGLSISRSLVEIMNGKIEVSSVEGKGTVFTVSLPVGKV